MEWLRQRNGIKLCLPNEQIRVNIKLDSEIHWKKWFPSGIKPLKRQWQRNTHKFHLKINTFRHQIQMISTIVIIIHLHYSAISTVSMQTCIVSLWDQEIWNQNHLNWIGKKANELNVLHYYHVNHVWIFSNTCLSKLTTKLFSQEKISLEAFHYAWNMCIHNLYFTNYVLIGPVSES